MNTIKTAICLILTAAGSISVFPQSVKYNGDIEAGVVVSRNFATAQINAATSHGVYLSKPQLFIGAGAAVGWNIDAEYWNNEYPVFGDIRKDFTINRRFLAFIDAKAGYTLQGNPTSQVSDSGIQYGFYCYPSIGLRFSTSQKCGVYIKLGYTYQAATFSYGFGGDVWISGSRRYNAGGLTASLGFSFQ